MNLDDGSPISAQTTTIEEPLLNTPPPPPPSFNDDDDDSASTSSSSSSDSKPATKGMILYCSLYFFHGISGVTWGRFGIIYYNKIRHLSEEKIGFLQATMPLIALFSQPFWGCVADWYRSKKKIYIVCKIGSTISLLSLAFVESFTQILFCVTTMALFRSAGVLDSHALDFLGEKHRGYYGTIRMWASISWGLGCIVMGYLTDHFGFHWNFVIFATMMLSMILLATFGLPSRTKEEQMRYEQAMMEMAAAAVGGSNGDDNDQVGHRPPPPKVETLYKAMVQLPVLFWLCQGVIIGVGVSLVDSFLFVYLQNDLHASTELCGWTVGVTVLLELPIFFFSHYLLNNVGHDQLFLIAMVAYIFRVVGYTLLHPSTVHYIFLMEILHGVTVSCMWIASVDFAAAIAPKEWSTAVQTILSSSVWCIGGGLGPMIGGWVMQTYGAITMYRGAGIMVGTWLLLHLVLWSLHQKGPHVAYLNKVKEEQHRWLSETDDRATNNLSSQEDSEED